jgi:hypothetical protein
MNGSPDGAVNASRNRTASASWPAALLRGGALRLIAWLKGESRLWRKDPRLAVLTALVTAALLGLLIGSWILKGVGTALFTFGLTCLLIAIGVAFSE